MDPSPGATRLGMGGGSEGIAGTVIGMGGGLEGMVSAIAGNGLGLFGSSSMPLRSGTEAGGADFLVPLSVREALTGVLAGFWREAPGGGASEDVSSCRKKRTSDTMEVAVMKNTTIRLRVRMNQSLLLMNLSCGKKLFRL